MPVCFLHLSLRTSQVLGYKERVHAVSAKWEWQIPSLEDNSGLLQPEFIFLPMISIRWDNVVPTGVNAELCQQWHSNNKVWKQTRQQFSQIFETTLFEDKTVSECTRNVNNIIYRTGKSVWMHTYGKYSKSKLNQDILYDDCAVFMFLPQSPVWLKCGFVWNHYDCLTAHVSCPLWPLFTVATFQNLGN